MAQSRQPRLSLVPFCDSPRSHAPIQFDAHLAWDFDELLEGQLQLDFYVDSKKAHTWISREVVLSSSEVDLAVMVPPVILPEESNVLNVIGTFVTGKGSFHYELDFPHWVDWKRVFVIGIVHPRTLAGLAADFETDGGRPSSFVEGLRLEKSIPDHNLVRGFASRIEPFDPGRIPSEPLELTAFDVLVVSSAGLDALKPGQLDAIARWVEAGGAACIAGSEARTSAQQQFLQRMLGSSVTDPLVSFDKEGHALPLLAGRPAWHLAFPGVGRALVTLERVDVENPEWQRAVLALWRVRPEQIENVMASGKWRFNPPISDQNMLLNPFYHPFAVDIAAEPDLQAALMPDRIEGVPFHKVALLLLACLLAIGPGDYILLGSLRLRRWTWVLFPSVAIGFSVYAVRLAHSHMGRADHRCSVRFVDLAADGRPVRDTRFELLFAASEHELGEELKHVYPAPVESRSPTDDELFSMGLRPQPRPGPTGNPVQLTSDVVGRSPTNFNYVRRLRQWEPHLSRFTKMAPAAGDEEAAAIPWAAVGPEALLASEEGRDLIKELESRLSKSYDLSKVVLLHLGRSIENNVAEAESDVAAASDAAASSRMTRIARIAALAEQVSARPAAGVFQLLAQLSPNGAGNFEDLTLLDVNDPLQWLLLVVVGDDEGDYIVYRRLMRIDPYQERMHR